MLIPHHFHLLAHPEVILLSLGAAMLLGLTSALQHSAATTVDAKQSLRPSLVLELLRRPRWLLGNLADVGAFALQFLALRHGSLLVVQALLVTGLAFALPISARLSHRRLRGREWISVLALVGGLAAFLTSANPTRGRPEASGPGWVIMIAVVTLAIGFLIRSAPNQPGRARAGRLGAACGILFGLDAALAKAAGHVVSQGLVEAVTSWEPYVFIACAAAGFLLAQSALHAGPLDASLPLLAIGDPLTAAMIGLFGFHEHIALRPTRLILDVASAAVMAAGVLALARSPRVEAASLDGADVADVADVARP
jgi:drug/metabolite transporter (DMT)-like permease